MADRFNFLIYNAPDRDVKVNAIVKDDTIWLTKNLWQNFSESESLLSVSI